MSNRDRRTSGRTPQRRSPGSPPPPPGRAQAPTKPPAPSIREQLASSSAAERALLPIRAFFGVTFVYAGVDKLLDPSFFDAASPGSIVAQLTAFAHFSPLAPLIRLSEPFAIPVGILIALAEIAIGLGALSGLAFRLAAAGGFAISMMFWLTASWTTHPYYYGADLPYAAGWLALLIAGHGNLLVPRVIRELGAPNPAEDEIYWDGVRSGRPARGGAAASVYGEEASPERRLFLQVGVLAAATFALASMAIPLRLFRGSQPADGTANGGGGGGGGDAALPADAAATAGTGAVATAAPGATAGAAAGAAAGSVAPAAAGIAVSTTAAVDKRGAVRIRIPTDAPAPLPAGDPAMIVKLTDGSYACYDSVCTHEGCRVGWDARDAVMLCPCHGAAFDPNDHGAVVAGPTNTPLAEFPIIIDQATGTISLKV